MRAYISGLREPRHLEKLYRFIFALGVLCIGYTYLYNLVAPYFLSSKLTDFNNWAVPIYFPDKRNEIFAYTGVIILLFAYFLATTQLIRQHQAKWLEGFDVSRVGKPVLIGTFALALLVNTAPVLLEFQPGAGRWQHAAVPLLWLAVLLLPVRKSVARFVERYCLAFHKQPWLYRGLIALAVFQLLASVFPLVTGRLKMINEFLDIPERTILSSGKQVDVGRYLIEHDLTGLSKYDVDTDTLPPGRLPAIKLVMTPRLQSFLDHSKSKFEFDRGAGMLSINGSFGAVEREALLDLVSGAKERKSVLGLVDQVAQKEHADKTRILTAEEREFIEKNTLELNWQMLNRWVIHHHNFVLGPINEYSLGKPFAEIYAQYGRLNIVVMTFLLKLAGGISYQNYFGVWYAIFAIYYLLFLGLLFYLFSSLRQVAVLFTVAVSMLGLLGFQILFLGPGLNPIRHFLDLFLIWLLHRYLTTRQYAFLAGAGLCVTLSILNNVQVGLCCLVALVGMLCFRSWAERQWPRIPVLLILAASVALSTLAAKWTQSGFDPVFNYYASGISGYPQSRSLLWPFLIASLFSYWVLFAPELKDRVLRDTTLFVVIFAQTMFVYCIWGGTKFHVLNLATVFVLAFGLVGKLVLDETRMPALFKPVAILSSFAVFGYSLQHFYHEKAEYYDVFKTHPTFNWDLKRAKFESTMDPKYFANGIALIQKHVPTERGIFILSRYDTFLPFLAEKYSAMPFFDMAWFLLTPKEVGMAVDRIRQAKPETLFVDNQFDRPLNVELVRPHSPLLGSLYEETYARAGRLKVLRDVFDAIRDDYEPVEKGLLITAYRRRSASN